MIVYSSKFVPSESFPRGEGGPAQAGSEEDSGQKYWVFTPVTDFFL